MLWDARARSITPETIAYNEAGHAVVAYEFGWWVGRGGVRINADALGGSRHPRAAQPPRVTRAAKTRSRATKPMLKARQGRQPKAKAPAREQLATDQKSWKLELLGSDKRPRCAELNKRAPARCRGPDVFVFGVARISTRRRTRRTCRRRTDS
jgi:hypothetical protein